MTPVATIDYTQISVAREGVVSIITLDRPEKLNAWTPRMAEEQVQAIQAIGHQVHRESCLAQALAQVVARLGLVFNNQDFHESAPHRTTASSLHLGWAPLAQMTEM